MAFRKELKEQLETGIVSRIPPKDVKFRNNVFLIQKKSGAWRQILDCRILNAAMKKVHFKCENKRTVERLIMRNDFAVTMDLSQAYYLIPVSNKLRPYLTFRLKGLDYAFNGMPFGYTDAPRYFTKVMRKVKTEIKRKWNVRVTSNLDNLILLHQDFNILKEITS
ncbi:uncharacterized protein MONOS_11951 [Monocercomonoides exilis]|uniref:uncharacterized protein n=1 Tax=Monocercomonoides exilis TaxID=2049356 RepID=UPI003559B351|nr:hypothetical protein MONOS_11951 [Monocercomonoides exilis]|eukprot:MONOS_11951.1-p1 / transcript=MONOS_11951.1 / gene=MONOS_11951 / organism=Monocercomonoides_exilis_PA203 / gene_product=unspecified product / transcript_product=unspecified product / location=Mono_scaffold00629:28504-28998(-) / protein_length=164 / sequence_SO=supercontig / SO=protein_coding / is_pseudo=false